MQGKKRAVVLALDIMCDAVDRYKELCEGRYCGQHSSSCFCLCQHVCTRSFRFSVLSPFLGAFAAMFLTSPPLGQYPGVSLQAPF